MRTYKKRFCILQYSLTLKLPITTIVVCFVICLSFCNQRGQRSEEQSDLGPHCLPVCKNRFEKFARIFSRHHKQTTFSDAGLFGVLRVNHSAVSYVIICKVLITSLQGIRGEQQQQQKKKKKKKKKKKTCLHYFNNASVHLSTQVYKRDFSSYG